MIVAVPTTELSDLLVAVITEVPAALPVTVPPETVATEVVPLDQFTPVTVTLSGATVASRATVLPTSTEAVAGVTVTPVATTGVSTGGVVLPPSFPDGSTLLGLR